MNLKKVLAGIFSFIPLTVLVACASGGISNNTTTAQATTTAETPTTTTTEQTTTTPTITTTTTTQETFVVTFNTNGGGTINNQNVVSGGKVTRPTNPTKEKTSQYTYTFAGWYKDSALTQEFDFDSAITSRTTIYAKWNQTVNKYSVTWKNYDDSELEKDTDVEYGATPTYDGATPTKASDNELAYTYSFDKWTPNVINVIGDAIYTATYKQNFIEYTVKFVNYDDTEISSEKYHYGDTVVQPTTNPTKESTVDKDFTFAGWDSAVAAVTGDVTYKATYTESARKYNVVWKNYDGTEIKTDQVEYNEVPVYTGAAPAKPNYELYKYTFTGWDKALEAVTGDQEYTAQFTESLRDDVYTITWDINGTTTQSYIVSGNEAQYTGETPTKPDTVKKTYTFSGWSPALGVVTSDITYRAQFTESVRKYNVTWLNYDGTEIKTDQVPYGTIPTYVGETPTKPEDANYTYTFSGWTPTLVAVEETQLYVAQFNAVSKTVPVSTYTITWNVEGVETTEQYDEGTMPTYKGSIPTREATAQYTYTFSGWTPTTTNVTGNATYTATFTENLRSYTITWNNDDNSTIDTTTVAYGDVPTHANATKEPTAQYTYTFSGWTPTIYPVTGDATYTATFTENLRSYTITFMDDNGETVLDQRLWEYGKTPEYNGATPTKPEDAEYTYTFKGWDPEISSVTGNQEYTAQFNAVSKSTPISTYTITWKDGDGNTLTTTQVNAGDTPTYSGTTPTKTATAQYTYTFNNGWEPSIVAAAADATYTATFDATVRQYTITWDYANGSDPKVEKKDYGTIPSYSGAEPTKAADEYYTYTFSGWTPTPVAVTGDATYTATYEEANRYYTITWLNYDDSEIDHDTYQYGDTPSYGSTPSRPATAQYTYTFKEWTPAITEVTGDASYTATYTETLRKYTITWKNDDDTTIDTTQVNYGTVPTHADPTKTGYTFSGWTPTPVAVTGAATYTATFTQDVVDPNAISTNTAYSFTGSASETGDVVITGSYQSTSTTISKLTIDATSGKCADNGGSYQINKNTILSFSVATSAILRINLHSYNYQAGEYTVTAPGVSAVDNDNQNDEFTITGAGTVQIVFNIDNAYIYRIEVEITGTTPTPATTYSITYVTEHGTAPTNKTNVTEITSADLPSLTADGYTFNGWYTNAARTTAATVGALSSDVTLYAKWTAVDSNTITTDTVYSFKGNTVVSSNDIVFTVEGGQNIASFTESKLTVDASHGKFVKHDNWYQINSGTILSFTTAQAVSIDITAYSAAFACTIVGPGLNQSVSGASISVVTNAGGTVTITMTANDYIGVLEISNRDVSKQADSMELHLITTAAADSTKAGNGTYKVYNAKTIYKLNEAFDPSGVYAVIGYTVGDDDVATANSGLVFSGFSSTTAGKKTITVSYTSGGETVSDTYDVYVIETAPSIVSSVLQVKVEQSYSGTLGTVVGGYNMFTTINQALDYLRSYEDTYENSNKLLYVNSGTYKEKLYIDIPNLTIRGANKTDTIIEYDSLYYNSTYASVSGYKDVSIDPNGFEHVTDSTQTMTIAEAATNCTLYDLTISNKWNSINAFTTAFGTNNIEHRALAMLIYADKVVVQECRLLGYQDTLEAMTGRSYFYQSYISGTVDFIFGTNPTMYFEECEIHSIYNGSTDGGYINAFKGANKVQSDGSATDYVTYGAIYNKCTFTADSQITTSNTSIARPWAKYSAVMIMNSTIGGHISTTAYASGMVKNGRYVSWGTSSSSPKADDSTIKHFEYSNNGAGRITATQAGVVVLTDSTEAAKYSTYSYIFGTTNGGITYDDVWTPVIITETPEPNTITATKSGGYTEGAYVEFDTTASSVKAYVKQSEASSYSSTPIDSELVRISGGKGRVDVVGLTTGSSASCDYDIKLVDASDNTVVEEVTGLTVLKDDRSGYAHFEYSGGVGAYNNDGTLKSNAVVLYLTESNKNTIEYNGKVGISEILKSNPSVPLDIRVIGTVGAATWNEIEYDPNRVHNKNNPLLPEDVIGANSVALAKQTMTEEDIIAAHYNTLNESVYTKLNGLTNKIKYDSEKDVFDSYYNVLDIQNANNITIEGIGTDAVFFQWGLDWKSGCNSIEVKNITFTDCPEDACSFEGSEVKCSKNQTTSISLSSFTSSNFWVHNCTFNRGKNYWDVSDEQDKHEGDGSTDIRYVKNITLAYNHYHNTHKTGLIGSDKNQMTANVTLHHSWYENCQSRMPYTREANVHMYNNYYDNSTGTTMQIYDGAYAFIENCYFKNDNRTFQLTQNSGYGQPAIKSYNNVFNGSSSYNISGVTITLDRTLQVTNGNLINPYFDTNSSAFYYDAVNHKSEVDRMDDASNLPTLLPTLAGAGAGRSSS